MGISGPILRQRPGRSVPECHFSVNLPRFGGKPLRRSVYIANQNTYSPERYTDALNAALATIKGNGVYDQIYGKWFAAGE